MRINTFDKYKLIKKSNLPYYLLAIFGAIFIFFFLTALFKVGLFLILLAIEHYWVVGLSLLGILLVWKIGGKIFGKSNKSQREVYYG